MNLKPFDIEKAKAGHPVVTREGLPARIICWDRNSLKCGSQIIALIKTEDGNESIHNFYQDGTYWKGQSYKIDLFMAPVKKEGWSIIQPKSWGQKVSCLMFDSKEKAEEHLYSFGEDSSVCHITWEE